MGYTRPGQLMVVLSILLQLAHSQIEHEPFLEESLQDNSFSSADGESSLGGGWENFDLGTNSDEESYETEGMLYKSIIVKLVGKKSIFMPNTLSLVGLLSQLMLN